MAESASEFRSETVSDTPVIRVEKLNDGKRFSEKSTEPSRDFNFVKVL